MDKIEMIVNQLPAPTWNRLHMNESRVLFPRMSASPEWLCRAACA